MSLFDRMRAPLRCTIGKVTAAIATPMSTLTSKATSTAAATVAGWCVLQLACPPAYAIATIAAVETPHGLLARGDAAASGAASNAASTAPKSGAGVGASTGSMSATTAAAKATAATAATAESETGSTAKSATASPITRSAPATNAAGTDTSSASSAAAPASGNLPQKASSQEETDASADSGKSLTFRSIVPSAWIEAQGAHAYNRAVAFAAQQDQLVPDSNAQAARVHAIFEKLIPFALKWNDRAKDWQWEIALIRNPDIDAIALPGGKFIIDTGMLNRLGMTDDETAILIGHLMAHALREHARSRIGESLQAIEQAQGIPTGITAKGVEGNTVNVAPELLGMRYGPDDETEADVIGADITSRAGFDPRAGLAYWQKVDRISHWRSPPAFTAAHPSSDKRLKDLKKRQKDMLELYAKAIGKPVDNLPPYREGKWVAQERNR